MDIQRLSHPSLEQFAQAAEICHLRWSYLAELDTPARLAGLQELGVELVVAEENGRMEGVCFVLPASGELDGEPISWVYLFQLATRPEADKIGGMLMWRIMSLYPAILSMGVTDIAERMYQVLRWKRYDNVWRGVHPLRLSRMLEDYGGRIASPWRVRALRALAFAYDLLAPPLEALLSWGVPCRAWKPAGELAADGRRKRLLHNQESEACGCGGAGIQTASKKDIVAGYLEWFRTQHVEAVDAGGAGRIAGTPGHGLGALRQHAALWRALRRRGAKFCEMLLVSPAAKRRAWRLGYVPLAMPAWYWDKTGVLEKWLAGLPQREFSFLDTDKIV